MRFALTLSLFFFFGQMLFAEEWPQWMGPNRDAVWSEKGIIRKFPADGLKVIWRSPVAGGFSGPSVADGKVFVPDFVVKKR